MSDALSLAKAFGPHLRALGLYQHVFSNYGSPAFPVVPNRGLGVYYHSQGANAVGEDDLALDSDDELDEDYYRGDTTLLERHFMLAWNRFMKWPNTPMPDAYTLTPGLLKDWAVHAAPKVALNPALERCFTTHLLQAAGFRVLSASDLAWCLQRLREARKAALESGQAQGLGFFYDHQLALVAAGSGSLPQGACRKRLILVDDTTGKCDTEVAAGQLLQILESPLAIAARQQRRQAQAATQAGQRLHIAYLDDHLAVVSNHQLNVIDRHVGGKPAVTHWTVTNITRSLKFDWSLTGLSTSGSRSFTGTGSSTDMPSKFNELSEELIGVIMSALGAQGATVA
eukprot:gene3435-3707_t